MNITPAQNAEAFLNAPAHTIESAVWEVLRMAGIADSEVMNLEHPLLQEIVKLKDVYYETLLRQHGSEVPGATSFIRALCSTGLDDAMAIASTAARRDVDAFLAMVGLGDVFPGDRIKTKESITHPKPHPEVFNLAFDSLGLPEANRQYVCAFEDDPRGVMSAKAAGLYVCAITTRFSREHFAGLAVAPDLVADSYQEFTELFGL